MKTLALCVLLLQAVLSAAPAAKATAVTPAVTPLPAPMQVVFVLTAMTLLPAVIVSVTPFLRITIVLHFLRQALGTQSAPSNQVLLGMALFFTLVIMKPVVSQAYESGWAPHERGEIGLQDAMLRGTEPLKSFLLKYCREKDLQLFLEFSRSSAPAKPEDLGIEIVAPAYILSELRAGFQIGAVLFFPFLIIDLIVASVTLSVGMVQLPPVMISAPFKILLFVLADGWNLVIGSLLRSFHSGGVG
jgi:flagellar biosynthetic protein FliP